MTLIQLLCFSSISLLIGFILAFHSADKYGGDDFWEGIGTFCAIFFIPIVLILLINTLMIANENNKNYVSEKIIEYNIKYDGLCKELEMLENGDETLVKTDVYKEVLNYNEYVTSYKEGASNHFLKGYYNPEIADNLKIIEF